MKYSICLTEGSTVSANASIRAYIGQQGGGNIESWEHLPCTLFADMSQGTAARVADHPGVHVVEPEVVATKVPFINVTQQSYDNKWGLKAMGFDRLHGLNIMGQGIILAYLDTGVSIHEDLAPFDGINFINPGTPPTDLHKHGTHVCGILGATLNNIGSVGGSPLSRIHVIKVLDDRGSGPWPRIMDGVNHLIGLTNGGANIVVSNHSYGGNSYPGAAVAAAFKAAFDKGVHLVCAAGNNGEGGDGGSSVGWPAMFEECIAVASYDQSRDRSAFSSVGPKVEIAAPGGRIYSLLLNNTYGYLSGTSMASPFVASAIACALQNGVLDPRSLFPRSTERSGRDAFTGFGNLDAFVLAHGGHQVPKPPIDPSPPVDYPPPIDSLTPIKIIGPRLHFNADVSRDPDGRVVKWEWYSPSRNRWGSASSHPNYWISYGLSGSDTDSIMGCRVTDDEGNRSAAVYKRYQVDMPDQPDAIPPTPPTLFKAVVLSDTEVELTWGPATDNVVVSSYSAYRLPSPYTNNRLVSMSNNLFKWVDKTAKPSTTYTYWMLALDPRKNPSPSTERIIVTTPAAGEAPADPVDPPPPDTENPSRPFIHSAKAVSSTSAFIEWDPANDNVGVVGYTLYRNNQPQPRIIDVEFLDTGLIPDTEYVYIVIAWDVAGNNSMPSLGRTVKTLPADPPVDPPVDPDPPDGETPVADFTITGIDPWR